MSHVAIGRKGRKNWRVIGMIENVKSKMATAALTSIPGRSMIESANPKRMTRKRYWAS